MTDGKLPLRYAFDLGTNSIGWAVYRLDGYPAERAPTRTIEALLGCGVRLFDDGRNPKDGRSLAEMRRVPGPHANDATDLSCAGQRSSNS